MKKFLQLISRRFREENWITNTEAENPLAYGTIIEIKSGSAVWSPRAAHTLNWSAIKEYRVVDKITEFEQLRQKLIRDMTSSYHSREFTAYCENHYPKFNLEQCSQAVNLLTRVGGVSKIIEKMAAKFELPQLPVLGESAIEIVNQIKKIEINPKYLSVRSKLHYQNILQKTLPQLCESYSQASDPALHQTFIESLKECYARVSEYQKEARVAASKEFQIESRGLLRKNQS